MQSNKKTFRNQNVLDRFTVTYVIDGLKGNFNLLGFGDGRTKRATGLRRSTHGTCSYLTIVIT